jgi:rod shape-determining protein MreD
MSKIFLHILRFILLLILQVFIIGKLDISTFIHPNILLLFLLLLPVNLGPAPTLFIGFFSGLVLDMFTDSAGFSSTGFLIVSYLRLNYIRSFVHADVREAAIEPGIANMGYRWFALYAAAMCLVYHVIYAFIESFRFSDSLYNLWSALSSAFVSLVLVFFFQILFFKTRSRQ